MARPLHSTDVSSRLPDTDRVAERDTQFLKEYTVCHASNTEKVYNAYGDTIVLLKKVKVAHRAVDTTAERRQRPDGKFGGYRVQRGLAHNSPQINSAPADSRPEENSIIKIPAIVEVNPSQERREMYGLDDSDTGMVHISRKWLDDRGIEIDTAEDHFSYKGSNYRINTGDDRGTFLDSVAAYTYRITEL